MKSAKQRLDEQISRFYLNDPIILNTLSLFDKVADPKQETIGIDIRGTKPKITYNPKFIDVLSGEVLETVLVMEGLKLLLGHATTRLREPKHITSLASDITVTEMQKEHFGNILGDNQKYAEQLGLPEKEVFEEYWRLLNNVQENLNEFIKKNWDKIEEQLKGEPQIPALPNDGDSESSTNNGNSGNNFKDFDSQEDAIKEYFNPNGTSTNGWGPNEFMEASIKNMVNEYKDRVSSWGKYTGSSMSEIIAANTPKMNWKMILRNFAKSITTVDVTSSRMKVNRRFELAQPGRRYDNKCHVLVAIDSSGSMSDQDLARGMSIVNSVFSVAKVSYIVWDTEVKEFDNNYTKIKKNFSVSGRGGTSVQLVFDWIKNQKRKDKFDGVVIFSDMYFEYIPDPKLGIPTIAIGTFSGDTKCPLDWVKTFVKMEME